MLIEMGNMGMSGCVHQCLQDERRRHIPDLVKSIFFMLFLFSIGYSVGAQFFRTLKGQGLKQLAFAAIGALVCAGTVILAAKIMGYDTGVAEGMFGGLQTASASLGVASETLGCVAGARCGVASIGAGICIAT